MQLYADRARTRVSPTFGAVVRWSRRLPVIVVRGEALDRDQALLAVRPHYGRLPAREPSLWPSVVRDKAPSGTSR